MTRHALLAITATALAAAIGGGAIGLSLGLGADPAATRAAGSVAAAAPAHTEPATTFPVNEYGETFGPGNLETIPDLVLAIADDGVTEGYVRDSELLPPLTGTPAQRAGYTEPARQVALYQSDGRTVIGTFTLQP